MATFTFFEGKEKGDASPDFLYNRGEATQITQEELEQYFNADSSGMLRQSFGSFDNYLGYMTEREEMIQSGAYDVGNWNEAWTDEMTAETKLRTTGQEDFVRSPTDPEADPEFLITEQKNARQNAYYNWANSEANKNLLEKYGVSSTIRNQDGDRFEFNGSSYVKTYKVDDHAGVGDYIKLGVALAAAGPLSGAVSGAFGGGMLAGAAGGVVSGAVGQLITTGEVSNSDQLLLSAIGGAINSIGSIDPSDMTGLENAIDNATWDLSGALGVDYETANNILTTAAQGVAGGQDVGAVAGNLVAQYGADVLFANVDLGIDDVEVPNVFQEGTSTIPAEAFESLIGNVAQGVIQGEQDYYDILRDFSQEGGLDFLQADITTGEGFTNLNAPEWLQDLSQNLAEVDDRYIQPVVSAIGDPIRQAGDVIQEQVIDPLSETAASLEDTVSEAIPSTDLGLEGAGRSVDLPETKGIGLGQGRGMFGTPEIASFQSTYTPVQPLPTIVPQRQQASALEQITQFINRGMLT
jgi:hypothetical protein